MTEEIERWRSRGSNVRANNWSYYSTRQQENREKSHKTSLTMAQQAIQGVRLYG